MIKPRLRKALALTLASSGAALMLPTCTAAAFAAAAPAATGQLPQTVSADALPTVQINGVAWSQVVVGNTVYVAGQFTSARPAGSPAGSNETARTNLLAYDITTGNLITTWAPTVNGTALTITASPDGKRIYVGGTFTSASGSNRGNIAAFDATTGALVTSFKPTVSAQVRAIATSGDTVYVGGAFSSVNGTARGKLAAVSASTGTLLPWAPVADAAIYAMVVVPNSGEVVVGGRFDTLNGVSALGSGALDATSGATLPWAVQSQFYDYGDKAAIYSLTTDGSTVYATGYNFGSTGNLENSFAADANGGTLRWVNGCLGDTYSSFPVNGSLYTVGHAHDCSTLSGGKPERTPRDYQYAQATTTAALGDVNGPSAYGWPVQGVAAPTLLHWEPTFTAGSFTGQDQAAWTITGNSQYVVAGGEFPTVNGVAQQGLTRFAVRSAAPNAQGPQTGLGEMAPALTSSYPGTVRAAFKTAWDRDDDVLTYSLLRGSAKTVVATVTASSQWWNRPESGLTDTTAPAGTTQTYYIRVTDPSGNTVTSAGASVKVATTASAYASAVSADGASDYWRLGESSPTGAADSLGASDLRVDTTETRGAAGAIPDSDPATTFAGLTQTPVSAASPNGAQRVVVPATSTVATPAPDTVSIEAWIKTTATTGGKIVGFGNSQSGNSSVYDRQIWMTDDGHLSLGDYNGNLQILTSSATYNDGQWHHVVGTIGGGAGVLYVDGVRVARQTSGFTGQTFSGYWRIGGDNLSGWPGSSSSAFTGTIDDVAIYPSLLTAQQVAGHYSASGRTPNLPVAPADPYGKAVFTSAPDSYWRLEDAAGSTSVTDTSGNLAPGVVSGGTTLGAAGIQSGKAAAFNGTDATIASSSSINNPTVYSEELWFNTSTTSGGKLIGFGNQQSGLSGGYDRHVYMTNSGQLVFGTYTGQVNVATSTKSYNDGTWHHMVATQGSDGMKLYVDGTLVATNSQTQAQNFSGYWRVGGDNLGGWPNQPSSNYFAGTIDEVSVYSSVLDANTVAAHFKAGGGNIAPTASFTATASATGPSVALDASASSDPDGTVSSYSWDFGDGSSDTGATTSHTYATAGTYTVTLTVKDDKGAISTSSQQVTVRFARPAAPTDAYGAAVYAANPDLYWRLNEASGTTAANASQGGALSGNYLHNPTLGAPGIAGTSAVTFDGQDDLVVSSTPVTNPTTYSEELWFNTTTTSGGKLIGFGDATDGESSNYDRHVWMQNDGTLVFGVWTGQTNTISSPAGLNDGKWHHVVATQGSDGMKLYVDGTLVGTNAQTQAQSYTGYWRLGGDRTWGGSSSDYFAGTIDEAAVYPTVLSAATVADHYTKGAPAVNQAPTAAFTSTVSNLSAAFDGSGSADADGTVASYSWDFGDSSAAGSGVTPSHTYTTAGTYQVKLTVTDDKGATGTVTKSVTVTAPAPVNQAPTASFTSTVSNLAASFDGSGSADADGTVASYSWDFGDSSAAGTGVTPSHTYTTAGTYQVKLTVTDDKGATGTVTKSVTVTRPAAVVLAQDGFNRTVTGGLGKADTGGTWTATGAAANYAVAGGLASVKMATAGGTSAGYLNSVSSTATDAQVTFSLDKAPTGGGVYISLVGRQVGTSQYSVKAQVTSAGALNLFLIRYTGGTETTLTSTRVAGVVVKAGQAVHLRVQVSGTGTTSLTGTAWLDGATQPTTPQLQATDTTAALQTAGGIGLLAYQSSSSTNSPITASFSSLIATAL